MNIFLKKKKVKTENGQVVDGQIIRMARDESGEVKEIPDSKLEEKLSAEHIKPMTKAKEKELDDDVMTDSADIREIILPQMRMITKTTIEIDVSAGEQERYIAFCAEVGVKKRTAKEYWGDVKRWANGKRTACREHAIKRYAWYRLSMGDPGFLILWELQRMEMTRNRPGDGIWEKVQKEDYKKVVGALQLL